MFSFRRHRECPAVPAANARGSLQLARTGPSVSPRQVMAVLLTVALLVAGCNSGASGGASAAGDMPITVAVVPGADNAPFMVAVREGLFRADGLKVTVDHYKSAGSEIDALAHGKADIAAGDYADFLYAEAHNRVKLHLIADGYDAAPGLIQILTVPGTKTTVTSPAALVGKTVATPEPQGIPYSSNVPYSMETLAADAVLQSEGVSPSSVTWRPMPTQDMIQALRAGTVSAILAAEPEILQAETQLGATEVLDACSGVTSGIPLSGYFSEAAFARAHATTVREFRAALAKAQNDSAMRGPVDTVLSHSAGMSAQDAALVTLGVYPTATSLGQVQRVATLMYDSGMIFNTLDIRSLVSG